MRKIRGLKRYTTAFLDCCGTDFEPPGHKEAVDIDAQRLMVRWQGFFTVSFQSEGEVPSGLSICMEEMPRLAGMKPSCVPGATWYFSGAGSLVYYHAAAFGKEKKDPDRLSVRVKWVIRKLGTACRGRLLRRGPGRRWPQSPGPPGPSTGRSSPSPAP